MRDRYGILIGTGLDKIRTTTLRIGTMGITASPQYVLPTLSALELALRDLGHKAEPGAGVGRRAGRLRERHLSAWPTPLIAVPDDFPSVFEGSAAHERAKKLGETRVVTARGADDEAELIKRIGRARVAINIRAHARFSDGVFAACRDLKMVSVWGTGTDNIDLEAAGRRGITVCNTPGVNAFAVAEHAIALMLTIGRRIPKIDREMRGGAWPREMLNAVPGQDARGVRHRHHRRTRDRAVARRSAWRCWPGAPAATRATSAVSAPSPPPRTRSSSRPTS